MDPRTKVFRVHRALAWAHLLLGICVSFVFGSKDLESMIDTAVPLMSISAFLFSIHFYTARACRNGDPSGKIASMAIACLLLFAFPIGTLIGLYLISYCLKPWAPVEANTQAARR